ncbi:zinc ribbon domain-containing protein [Candidatus Bathyarchaeota archaeon]|nr:zinc ribbon domain-containing protein [Candidatus Bathyarchaeota archaeon]
MNRGQQGGQSGVSSTQMDVWFTGLTSQEAFDTVSKTTDEVREKAIAEDANKKSRFSFLRRGKKERYRIDQTISPHLYRVNDGDNVMYFEFSDADLGGTQVKATFSDRTKTLVQNLKTKMPPRTMSNTSVLVCPTCGRPKQPEWGFCPYDGNKYN